VTESLDERARHRSTWNSYSHPTPFHVKRIHERLIHVKRLGRKDPR
jgi:hypothetical protein